MGRENHLKATSKKLKDDHQCMDASAIAPRRGDVLGCEVYGNNPSYVKKCTGGAFSFDKRSKLQANYVCTGSWNSGACLFENLSVIAKDEPTEAKKPEMVLV